MATLDDLSAIMKKEAENVSVITASIMKEISRGFHSSVVDATPVDTGTARSNWRVSLGAASAEFLPAQNVVIHSANWKTGKYRKSERALKEAGRMTNADYVKGLATNTLAGYVKAKDGDEIHIYNNTPYIVRLNEGWSKQAPSNFVEKSIDTGIRGVKNVKIALT